MGFAGFSERLKKMEALRLVLQLVVLYTAIRMVRMQRSIGWLNAIRIAVAEGTYFFYGFPLLAIGLFALPVEALVKWGQIPWTSIHLAIGGTIATIVTVLLTWELDSQPGVMQQSYLRIQVPQA